MEVEHPLFEISDPDNISIYLDVSEAERRLEYNDVNLSGAELVDACGWILECAPLRGDHGALKITGRSSEKISQKLESTVQAYFRKYLNYFSKITGESIPENWDELLNLIRAKELNL